ncbi:IreB family regulatory phosphoprotein [Clostridiales bacterium COT073_COT-073]|nr:IreB family regulatory phosphoprotein [Clostridiales bacterium COT073_COT-073]
MNDKGHTQFFKKPVKEKNEARLVLEEVYEALKEKGYNPTYQLVGYLISGDPTYITGHNNARKLIGRLERDELLEEMVNNYFSQK